MISRWDAHYYYIPDAKSSLSRDRVKYAVMMPSASRWWHLSTRDEAIKGCHFIYGAKADYIDLAISLLNESTIIGLHFWDCWLFMPYEDATRADW